MASIAGVADIASLIGEPARTAMLVSLMDGRALTASELATAAGVTPQTASAHLAKLLDRNLVARLRQGRHHYYRLGGPEVAAMLEHLMATAAAIPVRTGPRRTDLRHLRLCYDHLAGEIAVAIADALVARGALELGPDGATVTPPGHALLATIGIAVPVTAAARATRPCCRPCLDWSERRYHIDGTLGRILYRTMADRGWVRLQATGREVRLTPSGMRALEVHLAVAAGRPVAA